MATRNNVINESKHLITKNNLNLVQLGWFEMKQRTTVEVMKIMNTVMNG